MYLESKPSVTYVQKFINLLPFSLLNKHTNKPLLKDVRGLAEFYKSGKISGTI